MKSREKEIHDWIQNTFRDCADGIIAGIGEDCGVSPLDNKRYLLMTTDVQVQDVHFKTAWFTGKQLGMRAVEQNISDIASCGGTPRDLVLALTAPKSLNEHYVKDVFLGVRTSARKNSIRVVGGNISKGSDLSITITLTGTVLKERLCLRSTARVGDLICVTGTLGKSAAGLIALQKGAKPNLHLVKHFLVPCARLGWSASVSRYASSMIDISDGIGSELHHICEASGVGAYIESKQLPVSSCALEAAKLYAQDPISLALYGGEEYELLFTIEEGKLPLLQKTSVDFTVVGRILDKKEGVLVSLPSGKKPLGRGFEHF